MANCLHILLRYLWRTRRDECELDDYSWAVRIEVVSVPRRVVLGNPLPRAVPFIAVIGIRYDMGVSTDKEWIQPSSVFWQFARPNTLGHSPLCKWPPL